MDNSGTLLKAGMGSLTINTFSLFLAILAILGASVMDSNPKLYERVRWWKTMRWLYAVDFLLLLLGLGLAAMYYLKLFPIK